MDSDLLTPIETLEGSLSQRVYTSLRQAIITLKFPPGTVLKKGEICSKLGVSRSPVSEAIAKLSADKLVDVIPQSATRVSAFSFAEIREACFLREALELAAVKRVTENRTDQQLNELTRCVRLQELLIEDEDFDGFYQSDEDFHELLMNFTGFPGISEVAFNISLRLKRARMLSLPQMQRASESVKEHIEILSAIREKDVAKAEQAMKYHLNQLMYRIEELDQSFPEYFNH